MTKNSKKTSHFSSMENQNEAISIVLSGCMLCEFVIDTNPRLSSIS